MLPADRHVFVYGTLRRGEQRDINRLKPTPVFVGAATLAGTLYDLGSYPGLQLGGGRAVLGEVYRISAELEAVLDEIEEVWPQQTGEYAKRDVPVNFVSPDAAGSLPASVLCLVYEIAADRTTGKSVIEDGDWVAYRGRKAA
ncbi:MAG: gamma-glutamylcyclotransferase family protein [Pseudomonadota bacterium]